MLDRPVRRLIDPWLEAPAAAIAAGRVPADAVSIAGFALAAAGCAAIAAGHSGWGLAFVLANRVADGLDGAVARKTGATDVGGYLDFVFDVLFYGGVPLAFAVDDPARLLPAAFLIYSFMGTTGSFLAYAVIAAKRGVTSDAEGKKSFYYSVGLMEGTETVLFFTLFCLRPDWFVPLAWAFGALCWLTVLIRVVTGVLVFREPR